ncbi:Os03g0311000 [Oryza sativa Japonica Group]|jgi:hypothetical protein|uniref:Os03g0311000 protein n=2 Tax=Oryza sativa subsp. japonica TaxID=39947 RepID=A0A8J8XWW8_ORYSJ|nr:expressed protein [Oryza sativa Japonica Group]EEE58930.1 hypothetical protein OsJ_10594 [Oryza sativa Japonica Group]KAF2938935.1 hypothetical protein DAI22_03g154300 [Oryza sativa Japonica Group]BAF11833.1 Os03g0311000 [Oryza sativa Japonica Group]BAS83860.1 Os03g0311000 [Oryza sativa Japonica Group]|eukprot:NP_001049919.1 Os03g0311000 [Oryza sativa Japonica Group]
MVQVTTRDPQANHSNPFSLLLSHSQRPPPLYPTFPFPAPGRRPPPHSRLQLGDGEDEVLGVRRLHNAVRVVEWRGARQRLVRGGGSRRRRHRRRVVVARGDARRPRQPELRTSPGQRLLLLRAPPLVSPRTPHLAELNESGGLEWRAAPATRRRSEEDGGGGADLEWHRAPPLSVATRRRSEEDGGGGGADLERRRAPPLSASTPPLLAGAPLRCSRRALQRSSGKVPSGGGGGFSPVMAVLGDIAGRRLRSRPAHSHCVLFSLVSFTFVHG